MSYYRYNKYLLSKIILFSNFELIDELLMSLTIDEDKLWTHKDETRLTVFCHNISVSCSDPRTQIMPKHFEVLMTNPTILCVEMLQVHYEVLS
jgi:hypothetical protein